MCSVGRAESCRRRRRERCRTKVSNSNGGLFVTRGLLARTNFTLTKRVSLSRERDEVE